MSETTQADTTQVNSAQADSAAASGAAPELNPEAGIGGAAAFANAESMEILNLLGDASGAGSCCGGGCCTPATD